MLTAAAASSPAPSANLVLTSRWRAEPRASQVELGHDLTGAQVALETGLSRGAEHAAHRAADLRADADDVLLIAGPVEQRNADGLERLWPIALE